MENYDDLRELLDNEYDWPSVYRFKVIVPIDSLKQTEDILSDFILQYNYSKTKKFVSLTFGKEFNNADEVIYVYQSLKDVKGVMTL